MTLTVLKAARVVVPIAVFTVAVMIGDALEIRFGVNDYSLTWRAYAAAVYWLGLAVFPVGSWLVVKSIYDMARAADSKRWPVVKGRIMASEVEGAIAYSGAPLYKPKVRYQYTFAGHNYENDAVRVGRANFFTSAPAARIVARYPVGADVAVRCDPADPSEAILETSTDNARRNIGVGLVMLAVPFVLGAVVVWFNSR